MNWNDITTYGSNDPEHWTQGDNGASKYKYAVEQTDKYRASRNAFAARKHGYASSTNHPEVHGGFRTLEDMQKDIDTGHTILSGKKNPAERVDHRGFALFSGTEHDDTHHLAALSAGYDANRHIYVGREEQAKQRAARDAEWANRPKKNYDLWESAPSKAPSTEPSRYDKYNIWDDPYESLNKPTAAPAAKKGLMQRLRRK